MRIHLGCVVMFGALACEAPTTSSIDANAGGRASDSFSLSVNQLQLRAQLGQFVAAEGGGGDVVVVNRSAGGPWETFELRDVNGGAFESGDQVELLTHDGTHALRVEAGTQRVSGRATRGAGTLFVFERLAGAGRFADGDVVSIRAQGGSYLAAELGGGAELNANRSAVGVWEQFTLSFGGSPPSGTGGGSAGGNPGGGSGAGGATATELTIALKANGGQYVVAEQGGGSDLNANRPSAGVWETFTLVDLNGAALEHGDRVQVKTHDGSSLSAPGDGRLRTSRTAGTTEQFTLEREGGSGRVVNGDRLGFKTADGRYLVAEGGGGSIVNADRPRLGAWETFTLEVLGGSLGNPHRLVGRLRIDNGAFVDDTGPVLPVICHFGEAFSRYTRDRAAVRRQLDVIASAGYDGVRFWSTLGGAYWAGREVNDSITPNYWGQLRDFLLELKSRGMRGVLSQGDIGRIADRRAYMNRLADVLDEIGSAETLFIVEGGNEAWQTGEPDPQRLAQFVGYLKARHPQVLVTLTSPPSEDTNDLNAYSIAPADLFDVHGSRDGHWWDKTRHIFSITYEGARLNKRLGWQGEPTGPGAAVSVTEFKHELDDDTLAAMAAMSLMARQAWCFMSGPGVLFDSPIEAQPGFWTVPRVRDALPKDVMRFTTLHHGGTVWTNQRVFAPNGDTRADHASNADGRFVTIIYGPTLDYTQVRSATIEKVTNLGTKAKIFVGRK